MRCLQCQYKNLPDAVFCENCGTKFDLICPQCQASNWMTSKFCRRCGAMLTSQPLAPSHTPPEELRATDKDQAMQVERRPAMQSPPEAERPQLITVVHLRCCGLHVQRRQVVACLRLDDGDGSVDKELRTFGTQTWELLVLSDWLVAHGVTHAAIAETGAYWPRVSRVLEHAISVRLIKGVQDVEVVADLLAHGLVQGNTAPPQYFRKPPHPSRTTLIGIVAVLAAVLLTSYQLWRHPGNTDTEQLAIEPLVRMLRWQQSEVFDQYPAGTQFAIYLPTLERTPDNLPVEITLDSASERPSWLQFDQDTLRISGTPPATTKNRTYNLIFHAKAEGRIESRLPFYLTITGQTEPPLPPASSSSGPTPWRVFQSW